MAQKQYITYTKEWTILQEMAIELSRKNVSIYPVILDYFNPFADINELGTQIQFSAIGQHLNIDLLINSDEVIPNYELKQTARGLLSKKSMSKSKFNELYQDYVCSALIRVAREVFAYLPIEEVRVNAIGWILNTATGHMEKQAVVSTLMIRTTIQSLNLETIDPSDSMQNFIHHMKFSKTKGFTPIEKLSLK